MGKKKLKLKEVAETTIVVGEKVEKKSKAFWAEFKKFVAKGNIFDLAVAVVIGTAFNKIVSSLVSSIITPLTGLLIKTKDIAALKWVIIEAVPADEAAGIAAVAEVAVTYGLFLQSLLDFMVIAMTIFVFLKILIKVKDAFNRKEIEAAEAQAKADAQKKKADAEAAAAAAAAEAARQEEIKQHFIRDVAVQADMLSEIRDIMLRMEKQQSGK